MPCILFLFSRELPAHVRCHLPHQFVCLIFTRKFLTAPASFTMWSGCPSFKTNLSKPYGRMNHLCCDWNKCMLNIVWNTLWNCRAWWLPLVNERFVIGKLVAVSIIFFRTWCDKLCCQAQLHPSNRGRWFFLWGLFIWRAHCYQNQWNTALMEAAILLKMQTPAITLLISWTMLIGVLYFIETTR